MLKWRIFYKKIEIRADFLNKICDKDLHVII